MMIPSFLFSSKDNKRVRENFCGDKDSVISPPKMTTRHLGVIVNLLRDRKLIYLK